MSAPPLAETGAPIATGKRLIDHLAKTPPTSIWRRYQRTQRHFAIAKSI